MDSTAPASEIAETSEIVVREHSSEPMTMTEFAGWMQRELGGGLTQVLQLGAFILCCDVIAQDISKATPRLKERLPNNTARIVMPREHEIAAFLALEPNNRHTWIEFTEMMVLWKCLTQNAHAGILRSVDGTPLELIPFQTGRVQEKITGREVFYDVIASTLQEQALLGALSKTFPERDMIHVRGRMLDGMDGYSTMIAGKSILDTSTALAKYRDNLFSEEGQMRGVFTREAEGKLDDAAFMRLRSQFKILMNKFRQLTEPIVLEHGLKFEKISSNPKELELSQQFEAQIIEQCRLLRVPPHKVFLLTNVKYENLDTMEQAYVGDTLVPVAKPFEQRLAKGLLSPKDRLKFFIEYDREEMTLRDPKAVTDRVMKAAERGLLLHDEARAALGYNPFPNGAGQVRTIPANSTVVDASNKVLIGGKAATPADKPADEDADAEPAKGLRLVSSN